MIKDLLKTITISLITLSLVGVARAWTEPSSNPPASNVKAPITVSSDTQYKSGLFSTEYLRSYGTTLLATDSGDVGIGTIDPKSKLSVGGDGYDISAIYSGGSNYGIYSGGSVMGGFFHDIDGAGYARIGYGNYGVDTNTVKINGDTIDDVLTLGRSGGTYPTIFKQGTDDTLVINSNNKDALTIKDGNVGIGTTTRPITILDARISTPKIISGPFRNIFQIASSDKTNPLALRMGIKTDATGTNRYAGIEVVDDAGIKRNLILQPDGGNIGIGTGSTAPASKLEIKSTSDEILRLTRSGGTYPTIFKQRIDSSLYVTNSNKNTLSIEDGNVKFYEKVAFPDNRNISASDPRLNIQGVVKITQPSNSYSTSDTNLDLQGPIHIQWPWYGIKLGTSNATYGGGSYAISVGNIDSVSPSAQDDFSILYWTENGVAKNIDRFVIRNNGDIGIGTKSPKATLDINGFAKLKPQTSAPVTCSSTYKGSIAYASANNKLCLCNGTSWVYEGGAFNCGW